MTRISVMTDADARFATALATEEQWGYLQEDFQRLMHFEPQGCFVAWRNQERVGIASATSYRDYAFVGSLIVKKEERGRGIGEALLNCAVSYLLDRGAKTVELDGVFPAVSLYRRLGFKDKYLSLRLKGQGKQDRDDTSPYSPDTVGEVVAFDNEKTGLSRERVLRKLLNEFADSVHLIADEAIRAYAIVRPREGGYFAIGPFVAEDSHAAGLLLTSIMAQHSGDVLAIGVPEVNRDAVGLLVDKGFNYVEPSLRMYLGQRRDYESNVYGILAAEKG